MAVDFVSGALYQDDGLAYIDRSRLEHVLAEARRAFGPAYLRYAAVFVVNDRALFRGDQRTVSAGAGTPLGLAISTLKSEPEQLFAQRV